MTTAFFTSDLHGRRNRYETLWRTVEAETPGAVFLGGDLLPHAFHRRGGEDGDFLADFLAPGFRRLRDRLGTRYPRVFVILGNDDPRAEEERLVELGRDGLWEYAHGRSIPWEGREVHGYAFVPPSPFRLKDWERYDVSRYVPPGGVSPEEGARTVPVPAEEIRHGTILEDLRSLAPGRDLGRDVLLFHSPPHETRLDRAALDGRMVDHVPLDVNVGSIAIRRFIEERQPLLTLHGHIHESARLTGSWRDRIGRTEMFSGCHDGPELPLVAFDPGDPERSTRRLL